MVRVAVLSPWWSLHRLIIGYTRICSTIKCSGWKIHHAFRSQLLALALQKWGIPTNWLVFGASVWDKSPCSQAYSRCKLWYVSGVFPPHQWRTRGDNTYSSRKWEEIAGFQTTCKTSKASTKRDLRSTVVVSDRTLSMSIFLRTSNNRSFLQIISPYR